MTAKEYLGQAYRLDQRINSKLMQLDSLRSLSRKVTAAFEGEKTSRSRNVTSLEDTIIRMMETEDELNKQIDALNDIKNNITQHIGALENIDYQLLLEKRYLCFQSWDQIAAESSCSLRWIHILHARALAALEIVLLDGGANP